MSSFKSLQNITEPERSTLQELLLERIFELEEKKEMLLLSFDSNHTKVLEIEQLIKFNNYVYYWIENPTTEYLQ